MNFRHTILIYTIISTSLARNTNNPVLKQYITFVPHEIINTTDINETDFWIQFLKYYKLNPDKPILQEEPSPEWFQMILNPVNITFDPTASNEIKE